MAPPTLIGRLGSLLFGSKPQRVIDPFDPEHPLAHFSDTDPWTWRDAFAGTCILGSVGSGKTSGSGRHIARAMLSTGAGGLVLCAKPDEAPMWLKYARDIGREDDVILVTAEGPQRFNFLEYESARTTRGGGLTENIVQLLLTAAEAGTDGSPSSGGGGDPYWRQAAAEMLSHAIDILKAGRDRLVLAELDEFIRSAAKSLEQANDPQWQDTSFCAQTQLEADRRLPEEGPQRQDLETSSAYWQGFWAELDPKQRGGIMGQYSAVSKALAKSPMRELLCAETTFTPDDCRDGKIIILDLPILQYHALGRVAQALIKTCFQRSMQAQMEYPDLPPVFLWADEAQHFLTSEDQRFLTTARSARVATVFLTQSISNFVATLGENRKSTVDSLLGNLRTMIFHSQSDARTNEWAANWFGKTWQTRSGFSMGESPGQNGSLPQSQISISGQQSNDYLVEPSTFTTLASGGPNYDFQVEAIIGQGGRTWSASEQPYLRVVFGQGG